MLVWYVGSAEAEPVSDHVRGGGRMADRADRLDPATGRFTEYLLPRHSNMRRPFVDDRAEKPVFLVGSKNGASIVKVGGLN